MRTDDVLADLETQLRDARPARRRAPVRTALAVAATALLAGLVIALVHGGRDGRERPAVPPGVPKARVAVFNGTRIPGLAGHVAAMLSRRGFHVVATADSSSQRNRMTTLVAARSPRQAAAARSVADVLGVADAANVAGPDLLRAAGPRAQVVVVAGELAGPCPAGAVAGVVASIAALRTGRPEPGRLRYLPVVANVDAAATRRAGGGALVAPATLCREGQGACLQLGGRKGTVSNCTTLGTLRRRGLVVSDGRRIAILVPDGVRTVRVALRDRTVTVKVRGNVAYATGSRARVLALRS